MDERKVSGPPTKDIYKIIITDTRKNEDEASPLCINNNVVAVNSNNSLQNGEELVGFHIHTRVVLELS